MKVKSFFEDGFMWSKIDKDPDEVDVITDHLPEPKCGMDKLVESLREEKCCTICESAKAKGELSLIHISEPTRRS